jgi:hypothetical protein
MARPRKNPDDPKWNTCNRCGKVNPSEIHTCTPIETQESINKDQLTDVKLVLYAVSLAGVIAQGKAMSHDQVARSAMEYAEAALKIWK